MAQSQNTPYYSPNVLKRIQRDLTSLNKDPIIAAAAQPRNNDLTLWDALIRIPITHANQKSVDLHFNVIFPIDYPQSPPSIGFTFDFPYSLGASYKERSGPLKGKTVICLDILGNFGGIHTEWKNTVGSGWSPSYSVSSLLVNLQTILIELDASLSQNARDRLVQEASLFFQSHPETILDVPSQGNIDLIGVRAKLCDRGLQFAKEIDIYDSLTSMKKLVELEQDLKNNDTRHHNGACNTEIIDPNIVCYVTGSNYTEDILGYGLSCVRQGKQINFSTPAELISKSAYDSGVRQSSNKQQFKYFLPAFINKKHAEENSKWKSTLRQTLTDIGSCEYGNSTSLLGKTSYELFSRLINTLVLEIMKQPDMSNNSNHLDDYDYDSGDDFNGFLERLNNKKMNQARMKKSPSIAYFEAICSFWRTFYWLSESNVLPIKTQGSKRVYDFTKMEEKRLKWECHDVGAMLASFSVFQSSSKLGSISEFIDAYLDECFVRCVKWWLPNAQKKNATYRNESYDPTEVFPLTKVSRDITLFQLMFLRHVIGSNEKKTAEILDTTNGKAPAVLEEFQNAWRDSQRTVKDWNSFFSLTGCGRGFQKQIKEDVNRWIGNCVQRAYRRGKAYI